MVNESVRKKGLGRDVIELLKQEAAKSGVFKLSLFCEDKNVEFYQKLGFDLKGDVMASYA